MEYEADGMVVRNLMVPPAARTPHAVALVWDRPEQAENILGYQVYLNGELSAFSGTADITLRGLECGTEYLVQIAAIARDGELLPRSSGLRVRTLPESPGLDITGFGASGDGRTLNTAAIQRAIECCPAGGTVIVPKGVFLTGALFLKSNMTLYIEEDGVLLGSPDPADYPVFDYPWEGYVQPGYASLLNTPVSPGCRLEHITISGPGTIDANGVRLKAAEEREGRGCRGRCICLRNVEHLYLAGIHLRQSPSWCLHLIYCRHVSINGIRIDTKYDAFGRFYGIANADGIDPDSVSDLFIFHCVISSGDDCIAIKSGRGAEGRRAGIPSENIRITDCLFLSGFGVAIGSEMSGGVRNVLVRECRFENVYSIASLKAPRGRGGLIENIRYENCTLFNSDMHYSDCRWFRGALYVDQYYSTDDPDMNAEEPVDEGTPRIRDIFFENISLETRTGNAVYLAGLPECPLENIHLKNIRARGKGGLLAWNIRGLIMDHVAVSAETGENRRLRNIEMLCPMITSFRYIPA
ncbi:MAG: glycoside hydrolase family 28 protein [Lentisphaeria bacterium]|nr:glycoside hydrolase family 28 protein [Lentisphaeria bacterium]